MRLIGDDVYHKEYGTGKVIGFDGTNIVDFNGRIQSVFDRELIKVDKYNGVSPSTVTEMIEALREIKSVYESKGQLLAFDVSIALNALSKADKELNNK